MAISDDTRDGSADAHERSSRWQRAMVACLVALAVAFTSVLVVRDRQNAAAASSSPANARRDAVAVASLLGVARSLGVARTLEDRGILGLREIGLYDFRHEVVGPLGGTLHTAPGAWTLAMAGGWACLHFVPRAQGEWAPKVTRGVCSGYSIETSPPVSAAAVRTALRRSTTVQLAALDAADVSTAVLSEVRGRGAPFSIPALAGTIGHLRRVDFSSEVTVSGITVLARGSVACLAPLSAARLVRVELGPCAP